jgi:multiple sugar transport system permease protein
MKRFFENEERIGYGLLSPSVLTVALVAVIPIITVFWLSLHRSLPVYGIFEFKGIANYVELLGEPRFLRSLVNTIYITVVAVSLELVLGLAIAMLIHENFPGRGLARAAILIPWAIPTVVSAKMWEWILNPDFGLLNYLLGSNTHWLGHPVLAIHSVILVDVWKTTPFAVLLLLAGLQVIPEDLYRAGKVDGAGAWKRFFHITLPLLKPVILITILFRTLDTFRMFDVVYVLTGGGPANTTETLSLYAYKLYFQMLDFGFGSVVSVIIFVCIMTLSLVYLRLLMRRA